jgi:pilus assembly protein FimV
LYYYLQAASTSGEKIGNIMYLSTHQAKNSQTWITIITLCLILISSNVFALSAGEIEIHTRLNEPLNATIPLNTSKAELETLEVKLASKKIFKRIAMRYHPTLDIMTFVLIKNNGAPHIKITSNKPIREPMLEFALSLRWGNGHILKEFPIILMPAEH